MRFKRTLKTKNIEKSLRSLNKINYVMNAQSAELRYQIDVIKIRIDAIKDDISISSGRRLNKLRAELERLEEDLEKSSSLSDKIKDLKA